jgi:hypothetical protein
LVREIFQLQKNKICAYKIIKTLIKQKKIGFTFDGKKYYGFEGDTLASALLSNGVHLFGRSFYIIDHEGLFLLVVKSQTELFN